MALKVTNLARLLFLLGLVGKSAFAWTLLATGIQGWQNDPIAVSVAPANCPIPETELNSLVDDAIGHWNQVSSAGIKLVRAQHASDTDVSTLRNGTAKDTPLILCDLNFAADNNTDGDRVPAATQVGSASPINYGGVMLNAQNGAKANIASISNDVMGVVLAHEIGHLIGLGHSSAPNALMYYSVSNKTTVVVTKDDQAGVAFLYPRGVLSHPFGCGAVHRRSSADAGLAWAITLLLGLILSFGAGTVFRFRQRQITSERLL